MLDKINHQKLWIDETAPSWQSRCLVTLFKIFRIKQRKASATAVKNRVRRLKLQPASYKPKGLGKGIKLDLQHIEGWPVYYTVPSSSPDSGNYVLFLHGGGYIDEIVRGHWRIIGELTRKAKVRCIVPIYPLAPDATAKDVVPAMGELMRKVLEEAGSTKVSVVGNSAGAGLALAAAQWLRDSGLQQPTKLILISPGLNASIIRPEQLVIAETDPLLDIDGALEGARLYAGDLDLAHPFVSPLNGNFHDLPPMLVFSGTLDFLYPDSIDMAIKAQEAGVPIELHLKRGQPHNYVGMPTPEGRQAIELITNAVH